MQPFQRSIIPIGLSSFILLVSVIPGITAVINLPQTGQVTCYNSAGTAIDCAGTGQDGDIRAGVPWPIPRFVDNLDGTITDKLTGLMWLKDADCFYPDYHGRPWQEVLTKVADFNAHPGNYTCTNYTAAYNDWRLPNIIELESLPNEEVPNNTTWLDTQGFVHVNSGGGYFWSSTNLSWWGSNAWPSDTQWRRLLWQTGDNYINLLPVRSGQQGSPDPNYPANVWKTGQTVCFDESRNIISCTGTGQDGDTLRGVTSPDPRFSDNGNGTVTDNLTGLIWLKHMSCFGGTTWQGALNTIAGFNSDPGNYSCQDYTATFNDWRLPNRKELLSLVDFSQYSPPLPPGFSTIFAGVNIVNDSSLWSSTSPNPAGHGADKAWALGLHSGDINPIGKSDGAYTWAVRGGPTGSANFADISVVKTDSPDPVVVNQPLTYTLTLTNNGPDQANGVSLTDHLPPGVTFVSASSSQGTCSQLSGIVTCTIGSIANTAYVTVTIEVLAAGQAGTLTNSASVTSTSVDLYPGNNTATTYSTVSGPVNLPQTGQTTSYYAGDDGAIRAGVVPPNPRFTILYCNASGPCPNQASDCDGNASTDLITDNLTGLVWARDGNIANSEDGQWLYAMQSVQNVINVNGLCGYKDWRVPNINELLSLKISSALNSQGFVKVQDYNYWSSTTSPWYTTYALVAQQQYSWPYVKSEFKYHGFIPVRGGTTLPAQIWRTGQTTSYYAGDDGALKTGIPWPTPRFANTNGSTPVTGDVVLDNLTGLMWTKDANLPSASLTWNGGLDYIANMNSGAGYGGFKDWRLPNYIELRSLWDLSHDPAFPSGHPFTNVNAYYWSSSTEPFPIAGEAFWAAFANSLAGTISVSAKTESRPIWPVRGGFIKTLADAIRYLQILSGEQQSGIIGKVHDISGDGKVGMEEVINLFENLVQ